MKNCVVQFYMELEKFPNPNFAGIKINKELLEYSKISAKKYAEKYNHDYILITEPKIKHVHPTFERFDLFLNNTWWDRYSQILYLDTDIICWPDAPNIFEMYRDAETFKVCEDRVALSKSVNWHKENLQDDILKKYTANVLRTRRFNAGVFLLNKNSAEAIKPFLNYKDNNDNDNALLIHAMLASGVDTEYMDWRFNKKNGENCWFGHAYGQKKYQENFNMLKKAKTIFKDA